MIEEHPLFRRCVEFHGHRCPGLAIGYRAARAAMALLGVGRSADDDLVAVVENDSCAADAVQVLTGCTFGKGNLKFKDHGKQALTLGDRGSGGAVRVVMRSGALQPNPHPQARTGTIQPRSESTEGTQQYRELQHRRMLDILGMREEDLFQVVRVDFEFPEKAVIMDSEPCASCGEPTMKSRLKDTPRGLICPACLTAYEKAAEEEGGPDAFTIRAIGRIRTPFSSPGQCPHQGRPVGVEGEVVLDENMLPALKDLGSFSHIILLSFHHLSDRRRLQTRTPRGPRIRGTFATRSPNRPNPVALNVVELLGIEGNRLRVRGVDCLDGTPLIDIKPYLPQLDSL